MSKGVEISEFVERGSVTSSESAESFVKSFRKIVRNEYGLIEGVEYQFDEAGMINWRKMIKPKYLVPNREKTEETDITKLDDSQLLILLGGIKELAYIRGYTKVEYQVTSPCSDYVVACCRINWVPNFETEGQPVIFSAIGDASPNNTKSFAINFLAPTAENRAFVRCVRNFLRINIVGSDELGGKKEDRPPKDETDFSPFAILEKVMKEKNVTFNNIKQTLIKEDFKNALDMTSISDLPKKKIFELIERIQKAKVTA
jgi:hypothetical protein